MRLGEATVSQVPDHIFAGKIACFRVVSEPILDSAPLLTVVRISGEDKLKMLDLHHKKSLRTTMHGTVSVYNSFRMCVGCRPL